jgi:hypothetical protein
LIDLELYRRAADSLAQAQCTGPVFIGFDGFIDNLLSVVKTRVSPFDFVPMESLSEFAERIAAAAGKSANIEYVGKCRKLGGNAPILANALAKLGTRVTCAGALADPSCWPDQRQVDEVFSELGAIAELLPLVPPARTDALEFNDGKIITSVLENLSFVTRERIIQDIPDLNRRLRQVEMLAVVNWTMLPHSNDIFSYVIDMVTDIENWRGFVFIDFADPAKRPAADFSRIVQLLKRAALTVRLILSVNPSEFSQLCAALGLRLPGDAKADALLPYVMKATDLLGAESLIVHDARYSCSAESLVEGPFTASPAFLTGAGDNFNAGYCFGKIAGLSQVHCLAIANAVSGFYVRNGWSPTMSELRRFMTDELLT